MRGEPGSLNSKRGSGLNLFNTKYYEGVYTGHAVPGTLRAVQLTTELKF